MKIKSKIKRKAIYILLIIAFLISPLFPFGNNFQVSATGLGGWSYFMQIQIDNTHNSSTLTNYQIAITVNTAYLVSSGYMRSDCGDIRFLDSDNTTQITNYWVEPTTCNTTKTKIWVKIPSLTASTLYTIYMYYGNSGATTLSSTTNTFIDDISGVVGAWNFDEGTGTAVNDSSGNNNAGNFSGSSTYFTQGKYGSSGNFNGTDNFVSVPNSSSFNLTTTFSLSLWVYLKACSGPSPELMAKGPTTPGMNYDEPFRLTVMSNCQAQFIDANSTSNRAFHNLAVIPTGSWQHVVLTYSSGNYVMYLNGANVASGTSGITSIYTTTGSLFIGEQRASTNFLNGMEDQVRVDNLALTSTQVSEEYNNYGYTTTNLTGHELIRKYSSPDPNMYVYPLAPSGGSQMSDALTSTSGNPDATSNTNVTHYIQFISKAAVPSGKTFKVYMQCNSSTPAAAFNGITATLMSVSDGSNVLFSGAGTVGSCTAANVSTFSNLSFLPVTSGTTNAAINPLDVITITGIVATNPNTAATVSAPFIVDVQDNDTSPDEYFAAIPITSNGPVSLSATVNPYVTIGLSGSSMAFTTTLGVNTESSSQVTLSSTTNAVGGESIYVYDNGSPSDPSGAVGGLWQSTGAYKIAAAPNTGAGVAAATAELCGINAGTSLSIGGAFSVLAPFNSSTITTIGGFLKNTTTPFASSPGPVNGQATITWVMNVLSSTPAGAYTDSVTFLAVGSF